MPAMRAAFVICAVAAPGLAAEFEAPRTREEADALWKRHGTLRLHDAWPSGTRARFRAPSRSEMAEAMQKDGQTGGDVYGEVHPYSVMMMLANATAGQHYYDLGAGEGKTAAVAWSLGLEATGVELIGSRWAASCAAAKVLASRPSDHTLRYAHGSFFEHDWCDADYIFTAAVMFGENMVRRMYEMSRCVRRGTTIAILGNGASISWAKFAGQSWVRRRSLQICASWSNGCAHLPNHRQAAAGLPVPKAGAHGTFPMWQVCHFGRRVGRCDRDLREGRRSAVHVASRRHSRRHTPY